MPYHYDGLDDHNDGVRHTGMISETLPIRRRKLSDDVQERLISIIQGGSLKPGDALPSERELMASFAVGRPAIREAMQNLQRMGLVTIRHGERPRVAEPSMESMVEQMDQTMRHLLTHSHGTMEHLKDARVVFEAEMARIAARNRTEADVKQLQEIVEIQRQVSDQPAEFLRQDAEFHRAVAAISRNPIFESLSHALFGWLAHFHVEFVRKPGLELLSVSEHENITNAIAAGDDLLARRYMIDHLNRANKLYRQEPPDV